MRKIVLFLLTLLLTIVPTGSTTALAASQPVPAKAALVADAKTGQILYQQNARAVMPIASISKLLTVMVVQDRIDHHQLSWDTKVKISPTVAAVATDPEYSNVSMKDGETWTVAELTQAALVKSADGAALALGEVVDRSPAGFVAQLKQKARSLGINDAVLVNGVGLTNDQVKGFRLRGVAGDAENKMSARDVAVVASTLVTRYPRLLKIAGQKKLTAHGDHEQTVNKLLTDRQYQVAGVKLDGLKTGTSDAAGACLVSSGTYRGRHLVTVALNAGGAANPDARFQVTQALYQRVVKEGWRPTRVTLPKDVARQPLAGWWPRSVAATANDLVVWQRPGHSSRPTTIALTPTHPVDKHGRFKGPVQRGSQLAKIWARVPGVTALDPAGLSASLQAN